MTSLLQKLAWFIQTCLSDSGAVSFGRTMSALWSFYYMAIQAWFYHRSGHLPDNGTILTHLTVITTFYGVTKSGEIFGGNKQPPVVTVQP